MPAPSVLFDSLIDYAGLFPPAKLPMADAVRNHASYLRGPHSSRLGRFVLPLGRLGEFEAAHSLLPTALQAGWGLSVLAGNDPATDFASIAAHNLRFPAAAIVSLETKASSPAAIPKLCAGFPASLEIWIEVPWTGDVGPFLQAIRLANGGAKIRTGGVVPEAFPAAADVARFLAGCRDAGVVCKATAGLHHPLRGDYPLTYEPNAPRGTMFGFLNVFLAATLLHAGGTADEAAGLLAETAADNFQVSTESVAWRTRVFSSAHLAGSRQFLCRSFGCCSFTEPLDGAQELGWL